MLLHRKHNNGGQDLKTFWIKYLTGAGVEEEISASGSDAYAFAEEIEESNGTYYGLEITDKGWREGL